MGYQSLKLVQTTLFILRVNNIERDPSILHLKSLPITVGLYDCKMLQVHP